MGQLNIKDMDDVLLKKLKMYAVEEEKTMKSVVEDLISSLCRDLHSARLLGGIEDSLPVGHAPKTVDVVLAKVKGVKRASEIDSAARDREVVYEQD